VYELIKNIGLGLFVNGSYAIMNLNITIHTISITLGSILIMASMIYLERKDK
jgi:hypothetical protein